MPTLSGNGWKVMCVAMRQTWGWIDPSSPTGRKQSDRISYSQFMAKTGIKGRSNLARALREGLIGYAALDVFGDINVFAPEGFPTKHPLFALENVLLTPHVAACSREALYDVRVRGAQAVADVLAGRWPAHPVNPEVKPWFDMGKTKGNHG